MPEDNTPPSTDGDQASTSGLPQAGTSTTDGQAPVSQPAPSEHERIIAELRKENAAARKRLSIFEEAEKEREAAKKAAEDAQLSEIERVKKLQDSLQAERDAALASLQEERVHRAVASLAPKLNFVLSSELVAQLLPWSEVEFDAAGKPTNVDKLLERLAKAEPKLVMQQEQTATPGHVTAPPVPAMNPGRTQITPPSQVAPTSRPTLAEAYQLSRQQQQRS